MFDKIVLSFALLAAPALALAQAGPDTNRPSEGAAALDFESLDANADGMLSQTEISGEATLRGRFKDLDIDRDGNLSNAEFSAFEGGATGTNDRAGGTRGEANDRAGGTRGRSNDRTGGTRGGAGGGDGNDRSGGTRNRDR